LIAFSTLADLLQNQDVPRFANKTSDLSLAANVATFVLMYDGIPIVYQGQEQHYTGGTDPFTNREPLWETGFDVFSPLYQQIATLNTIRRHAIQNDQDYLTSVSSIEHQDDNTLVLSKGSKGMQVITVMTNSGKNADDSMLDLSLGNIGYKSGSTLTEVLSCKNYTLNSEGSLSLSMSGGKPAILYPAASMTNSSLCGQSGDRFYGDVLQTVTAMTTTATVSSTPTVLMSTASMPIISSEITSTAPAATSSSAAVLSVPGNTVSGFAIISAVSMACMLLGGFLIL
jgi:alpha-amylase